MMMCDVMDDPKMTENDIEDCLDDFMETEFNVIDEENHL
jgi:hypothetical protein